MPKTPSAVFITEKNKQEPSSIAHLFEVQYASGGYLYLTDYNTDLTYPSGSQVYTAFPITFGSLEENREGSIPNVTVNVANASRVIGYYAELYNGLRGQSLVVKTVFVTHLDDANAYTEDKYTVDSCVINESQVSFNCSSRSDIMEVTIPKDRFGSMCRFVFKGTQCLYSGGETTCDKSLARCKVLNNQERFGGFSAVKNYGVLWR